MEGIVEFKGVNINQRKDRSCPFLWKLSGNFVLRRKKRWEEAGDT